MIALVGCVAETEGPPPVEITTEVQVHTASDDGKGDGALDVCALAAELPSDDICSLICDPDALAAEMEASGSEPGKCYQLYCMLPEEHHVLVGVCLF